MIVQPKKHHFFKEMPFKKVVDHIGKAVLLKKSSVFLTQLYMTEVLNTPEETNLTDIKISTCKLSPQRQ